MSFSLKWAFKQRTMYNNASLRTNQYCTVSHLVLYNMAQRHVVFCERYVALNEHHVALLECHVALHVRHVVLLISRQ